MHRLTPDEKFEDFSDVQLAGFVKTGSERAFEEITERYKGLVFYFAKQFCNTEFDLCDFTQEGLMALLSACKSYDEDRGSSFKNYVSLCIKNRLISIVNKNKLKGAIPEDSIVSIDDIELSDKNLNNPENLYVSRERLEDVLSQMKNSLSQKEIKVFYLYLKGLNYEEISKSIGLTKKSVDNALQRVKKKLQS